MRVLVVVALALAGCGTTSTPMTTEDGKSAFRVECNGTLYSWNDCYVEARKLCSGNYKEIRRTDYARGEKPIREIEIACNV
jgi:hypothetical protein